MNQEESCDVKPQTNGVETTENGNANSKMNHQNSEDMDVEEEDEKNGRTDQADGTEGEEENEKRSGEIAITLKSPEILGLSAKFSISIKLNFRFPMQFDRRRRRGRIQQRIEMFTW